MKTTDWLRQLLGACALALAALGYATTASADGVSRATARDCCGYDWRGFYFGGHIGLSYVDVERSIVNSPFWATGGSGVLEDVANGRLTLGGHLGYNFTSGPWVFGIEATLTDVSPRQNVQSPFFPVTDRWRIDVDGLTTVTGRLGYAMNKAMVYVKAGYAGADVDSTVANQTTNVGGLCGLAVNGQLCQGGDSKWHNGWTVGTGIELSVHKNVIVGFEYNYIDLGSESTTTQTSAAAGTVFLNQDVDVQIHSFMGRVSYKFN